MSERGQTSATYSTDDIAEAWGVTAATARRWARLGRVPARRTPGGSEWRFEPGALPGRTSDRW